jgi:subtilase family serine protease
VDAYDDPNAYTDLAAFSSQFGVEPINPTTFQVVYAPSGGATPGSCTGSATEPPVDPTGGWEVEESLDIEWAHAMAPGATLYLVEAQSNFYTDLLCAVTVASNLVQAAGGGEVSMSWGGGEFSGEITYDPVFTTHGVVYFAAAGDSPGVIWPSASPNVVSVGGTTLSTNAVTGSFIGENVWQDGGGGPSAYESRPSYQNGIRSIVGAYRGTPDVAADANPYTGVWVLDNFLVPDFGSTYCGSTPCWLTVGGTSVATPMWAGIVNAAGSFSATTNAELTKLYGENPFADFNDITLGSCGPYLGYFASAGWDFCSGLGSPDSYRGK